MRVMVLARSCFRVNDSRYACRLNDYEVSCAGLS
jgi:hypothetical protein